MKKHTVHANTVLHRILTRFDDEHKEAALYEIERQGLPPVVDEGDTLADSLLMLFLFESSHEGPNYWWDYYYELLKIEN